MVRSHLKLTTIFPKCSYVIALSVENLLCSNGIAVVVVDNEAFKWMRGENQVLTWKKTIGNWETSFCRVCGSTLPGINDESRMYVPAGLITNGDESLKVVHHIWVDSKAVLDEIGDSGKQHRQAYKDK